MSVFTRATAQAILYMYRGHKLVVLQGYNFTGVEKAIYFLLLKSSHSRMLNTEFYNRKFVEFLSEY